MPNIKIKKQSEGVIFDGYYYRTIKLLTSYTGQWPYGAKYTKFIRIVILILLWNGVPFVLNAGIKLWKKGKMEAITEVCPPVTVVLTAMIKFSNSVFGKEKLKELLEVIENDWSTITDKEVKKILVQYAERGRAMAIFYTYYLIWSLVTYMMTPFTADLLDIIAPSNVSRKRRTPVVLDYFIMPPEEVSYSLMWCHCGAAAVPSMFLIIGSDALYITLVTHCCGIFARTRYYMEHFADEVEERKYSYQNCADTDLNIARVECIYRKRLAVAVELHQKAIEFCSRLDSSYAISCLFLIGMNMIITSITCLHIIMKIGEWEEIFIPFIFTGAQLIHLLFLCLLGQFIINESLLINTFSYTSEWYNIPYKIQKMVGMVLGRSTVSSTVSAGYFFIFKMETFSAVMQTSMSYLTVMSSFE